MEALWTKAPGNGTWGTEAPVLGTGLLASAHRKTEKCPDCEVLVRMHLWEEVSGRRAHAGRVKSSASAEQTIVCPKSPPSPRPGSQEGVCSGNAERSQRWEQSSPASPLFGPGLAEVKETKDRIAFSESEMSRHFRVKGKGGRGEKRVRKSPGIDLGCELWG